MAVQSVAVQGEARLVGAEWINLQSPASISLSCM